MTIYTLEHIFLSITRFIFSTSYSFQIKYKPAHSKAESVIVAVLFFVKYDNTETAIAAKTEITRHATI